MSNLTYGEMDQLATVLRARIGSTRLDPYALVEAMAPVIDEIIFAHQGRALDGHGFDTASSASRQHYIETGRYLRHAEAEES